MKTNIENKVPKTIIMRHLINFGLSAFLVLFIIPVNTFGQHEKIERIENELLNAIVIQGQHSENMSINDRMKYHNVPGLSIAVINNFKIEWVKCYGVLDKESKKTVIPRTLFQAASISKSLSAMAALQLVQDGKIDLNENINNKLTSWKVPENEFTINQKVTLQGILNHSAGLTVHGFSGYASNEDIPTLLQVLDGQKPANSEPIRVDIKPDSIARYSGGGYIVLQQLFMDLENKPFHKIMKEIVFKPLGMKNSTYQQPLPKKFWSNTAKAHHTNGELIVGNWHTYPELTAAGLWTTPTDLAKFAIEIMLSRAGKSNKILSKEITNKMLTRVHGNNGLGFNLGGNGESFYLSHGGSNEGYKCNLIAFPEKGQGAVIMTNGDGGGNLSSEITRAIAKEYDWGVFMAIEKTNVEIDPMLYDQYVGEYEIMPEFIVKVSKGESRLILEIPGEGLSEYFPETSTHFIATNGGPNIWFVCGKNGEVNGIGVLLGGQEIIGKKL